MDSVERLNRRLAVGALALAVLAALAIHAFLAAVARRTLLPQTVSVVVAATDIPAHTALTATMLSVAQYIPGNRPARAFASVAAVTGAITTTAVYRGQPLVAPDVARQAAPPSLSFAVAPGMRAYAVAVNITSGVGDLIVPGDHVDVLGVFTQNATTTVDTLLQDVPVLAVGQQIVGQTGATPTSYSDVTLEVSPANAALLAFTAARGTLQLELRAVTDGIQSPVAPQAGAAVPGA